MDSSKAGAIGEETGNENENEEVEVEVGAGEDGGGRGGSEGARRGREDRSGRTPTRGLA